MSSFDRWSRDGMPEGDAMRRIQSGIDATMRAITSSPTIGHSTSMIPDRQRVEEKPRAASGGTVEVKPPPGIDYIDRMCEQQDRIDRAAAARVRIDTDFAERLLDKGPRIETEWNPFDREHMKK